ncbi:hypothetical protein HII36_54705 [Nonomuraea sp. NN258]|uniref:hypothetical protein n=1 Tax=Nonomuraea antri TaxID=2730852 RepID=UPI0015683B0B|nr:hypothetical protein [Nonomuraea antri]NRQ40801.1 hypothetical protein [Nonomuraea antri]
MTQDGYYVEGWELRRHARVIGERQRDATDIRDELRAAFDRDRRTLGDDEYGAELAKKLPAIEAKIFDTFQSYLDELEGIMKGLHGNAGNYGQAERAGH